MHVLIPVEDRKRIVSRPDGSTSMVAAAAIQTPEELAFAIRFLTDHYLYKRSKASGVNRDVVVDVVVALGIAAETFAEQMGLVPASSIPVPVSRLPDTVENPYNTLYAD